MQWRECFQRSMDCFFTKNHEHGAPIATCDPPPGCPPTVLNKQ